MCDFLLMGNEARAHPRTHLVRFDRLVYLAANSAAFSWVTFT